MVLNVADRSKVMGGMLPISPGSQLAWVGFSETGILSSYDSKVSVNHFLHIHFIYDFSEVNSSFCFSVEVHCDGL